MTGFYITPPFLCVSFQIAKDYIFEGAIMKYGPKGHGRDPSYSCKYRMLWTSCGAYMNEGLIVYSFNFWIRMQCLYVMLMLKSASFILQQPYE